MAGALLLLLILVAAGMITVGATGLGTLVSLGVAILIISYIINALVLEGGLLWLLPVLMGLMLLLKPILAGAWLVLRMTLSMQAGRRKRFQEIRGRRIDPSEQAGGHAALLPADSRQAGLPAGADTAGGCAAGKQAAKYTGAPTKSASPWVQP